VGVLLGAVYLLWMFQRVFLGDRAYRAATPLKDVSFREITALAPIILLIFWIGLYPKPLLKATDASLTRLSQMVAQNAQKSLAPDSLLAGAAIPPAVPGVNRPDVDDRKPK